MGPFNPIEAVCLVPFHMVPHARTPSRFTHPHAAVKQSPGIQTSYSSW
jgi:hypothetical protein